MYANVSAYRMFASVIICRKAQHWQIWVRTSRARTVYALLSNPSDHRERERSGALAYIFLSLI